MTQIYQSPTVDDRILWDLHLSGFPVATLLAADELGVFQSLAQAPSDLATFARRHGYQERGVGAMLPLLTAMGLLVCHGGVYSISDAARNFLLPGSEYYWGPVLERFRVLPPAHTTLVSALKGKDKIEDAPVNAWESGQLPDNVAGLIARYMHSHSLTAAVSMARAPVFANVRRLLDVGAGSGCYSIALAQTHPQMHCVVMDLASMCRIASDYIAAAGVSDRVITASVNMFREPWPKGFDALLFSNIFHDWGFETCRTLAVQAFESLEKGGRIFLHEALLDDTRNAPLTSAAFSMQMFLFTRGQQFTFADLVELLQSAGFKGVQSVSTHAYFSVVSASKP
jgi:precorrin-6B methylase 2